MNLTGSVALPVSIRSVPSGALREAAQRLAAGNNPTDTEPNTSGRLQTAVRSTVASQQQQVPAHVSRAAAPADIGIAGHVAVPNGGLHSTSVGAVLPPNPGLAEVAVSSGGFDSWLNARLPASEQDAASSGPTSLLNGPSIGAGPAPASAKPRWIAGDADAGCARAAPIDFSTSMQPSAALHGQAQHAQTRSPH